MAGGGREERAGAAYCARSCSSGTPARRPAQSTSDIPTRTHTHTRTHAQAAAAYAESSVAGLCAVANAAFDAKQKRSHADGFSELTGWALQLALSRLPPEHGACPEVRVLGR